MKTTKNKLTMTQAYLQGVRELTWRQVPVPQPGPGQVLVKIDTALTCGTDLKTFQRGHAKLPVPGPLGHEAAGVVAAVGPDAGPIRRWAADQGELAWHDVKAGDAVMWAPTAPCHRCEPCRQGLFNHCETLFEDMALGTYADYVLVPERIVRQHMFLKPDDLPFAEAALMEPFACILRGWRRLEADGQPMERVLIVGVGAIGLQHVAVAKARGVPHIVAVGGRPAGLDIARQLGAHHAVAGHVPAVIETLRAKGLIPADAVIESTGNPGVWAAAPQMARAGGKVLLFGGLTGDAAVSFSAHRIHYDEVTLLGSFHYTTPDLLEAYRLLASGTVTLGALITDTGPLQDLPQVFAKLERGEGVKYALRPAHDGGQGHE